MRRTYIKRRRTVLHFSPLVDAGERAKRLTRWVWGKGFANMLDVHLPIIRFNRRSGVSDAQREADR